MFQLYINYTLKKYSYIMSKEITIEIPEELAEVTEEFKNEESENYFVALLKANQIFLEQKTANMRTNFLIWLMMVFTTAIFSTLVLPFLIALKIANLSEAVILALIAGTVAELGGMLYIATNFLFQRNK